MNVLVAFLGYKSETCLPKSKCLKSMPISIFWGGGGVLVNVWRGVHLPAPPRKSAPETLSLWKTAVRLPALKVVQNI